MALALEQIFGELRQLAGSVKARRIDHEGRQHFGIAVFPRMGIEHEIHQGTFELRPQAPIHRKARASDFGGALQIQDSQLGAQFPMRLGREIKFARLTAATDLDVVLGATAHWDRFVRQVRNPRQQVLKFFIQRVLLFVKGCDPVADGAHGRLLFGGVDALLAQCCDFGAFRITARLQFFRLPDSGAAARIQIAECIERRRIRAGRQTGGDCIEIGPEIPQIVHFPMLTHAAEVQSDGSLTRAVL